MKRILMVDDDPSNHSMLNRILRKLPYVLEFADSGEEALDKLEAFHPDLVILDIMMKGMDGYEVCRYIKTRPETQEVMVLLLSGKSRLSDRLKGYGEDADDFLAKPFDSEELKARVSILLRLKTAIDTAKAAEKKKADFLAVMSHEIRNSLGGMIGMMEIIGSDIRDDTHKDSLRSLRTHADALLGLINGILDFSKMEAGKTELASADFNLLSFLDDSNDILSVKAGKKELTYACIVDSDVPEYLTGDVGRLRQILLNLGGNALKFTQKGHVCLHISLNKQVDDTVNLIFKVNDSGIGISIDALGSMFDTYTQADPSIADQFGGTGLGLSISRELARLMGGDITVTSTLGQGTEFTVTLPFLTRNIPSGPLQDLKKSRLIYADPHHFYRNALEELCKRWAVNVTCVATIADAAILLSAQPFDAFLLSTDCTDIKCLPPGIAEIPRAYVTSYGPSIGQGHGFTTDMFTFFRPIKPGKLREWLLKISNNSARIPWSNSHKFPVLDISAHWKQPLRILLVDDCNLNLKITGHLLRKFGCTVTTAKNGIQALDAFEAQSFDLIFMDSQMPYMGGVEATRKIREREFGAQSGFRIPIVALTGDGRQVEKDQFLDAGANDVVIKPITMDGLKKTIEQNHVTMDAQAGKS